MKEHIRAHKGGYLIYFIFLCGMLSWASILLFNAQNVTNHEINNAVVNVRRGPGITYDISSQAQLGDQYITLNSANNWLFVRFKNGQSGWIPSWLTNDNINEEGQGMIATIISDKAKLYQNDNESQAISELKMGDKLSILHVKNGWAQVQYNGDTAWINQKLIEITPGNIANEFMNTINPEEKEHIKQFLKNYPASVITTTQGVNIREKASTTSGVIRKAKHNETFAYLGQEDAFYHVLAMDGTEGYVANWLSDSDSHVMADKAKEAEATTTLGQKTIVLDPGHGGQDPGGISKDGKVYEKTMALKSAMAIKKRLESAGAKVIMTRNDDTFLSLAERVQITKENKADIFISCHYDAADQEAYSGSTVYYYNDESIPLAEDVQAQLMETLPIANNGALFGNFQVIRDNNIPGLLLELGYMSNKNDLAQFSKDEYHEKVSQAVYQALVIYFQN